MRAIAPPQPGLDDPHGERLVLRDGTLASVRPATAADRDALRQFFKGLSIESRRKRFFASGDAPEAIVEQLCDASNPSRTTTLLARRQVDGTSQIIAAATYASVTDDVAEIAFAVDDRFQGKGISTLMLEQLAALAMARGFTRFHATTLADNDSMREVFRDSGFEIRSKSNGGAVDVQLALAPPLEGVLAAERRRHQAVVASLKPMMAPRAIAVIGASRNPQKIGGRILGAITAAGFRGPVYVTHPAADEIQGVRTYRSLADVGQPIDMAILAVPPRGILAAVDACAAAGVRSLVVITAGFAEVGPEGAKLQRALAERVREHGMRMVGPNCMGLLSVDPAIRLNASFSPIFPAPGHVALSSQSGALGIAILGLAARREVGLSAFVSVGNKADVSSNDLLEYWEDDPATRVILLYLESFGNPRRFARVAHRIGRTKPIVAIKSGRTKAGVRAAGSHTAALAASESAVDALFRQSGVIRAQTIDEIFDIAACLDAQPLPGGARVAIVTNAGGPGILAVDACEGAGLEVAALPASTRAALASFLPSTASVTNPVDLIASAGREGYRRAVAAVMTARGVDAVVIIFAPVKAEESPEILAGIREGIALARAEGAVDKPVMACIMGDALGHGPLRVGSEVVPAYEFPENAIRALGKIAAYAQWRNRPAGLYWGFDDIHADAARHLCESALTGARGVSDAGQTLPSSSAGSTAETAAGSDTHLTPGGLWLNAQDTCALLHAYGIPAAASALARTSDEAAALASVVGFPVAAKIASAQVQHKTDIGGVRLNLSNAQDVRRAFSDIVASAKRSAPDAVIDGVVIQPMVAGGVETIVGIAHDPIFGPLVGFGVGGVDVELLGDVRFRIAPLTDHDADELLHEIRGYPLLQGYRGRPPADVDALRDILLRVSQLAEDLPEVVELDLNPVIALSPGKGCRVVDARIRLARAR